MRNRLATDHKRPEIDIRWARMVRDDYKLDTIRIAVRKVAILDFVAKVDAAKRDPRNIFGFGVVPII